MTHPSNVGAALLLLLTACAHTVAPARPNSDVVWPKPPAAPRVRLVAVFPPPAGARPAPSFMRRAWEAFSGVESLEEAEVVVRPFGVGAGTGDRFFVADPESASVLRVDARGSEAIRCTGIAWAAPMALVEAPDGTLLVADAGLPGVVRVGPDGSCSVLSPGAFARPTGVAIFGDRIYVVDSLRHELLILGKDGAILERRGGLGEGAGKLHYPVGIAVLASKAVLVTDSLNGGVARWESDGSWSGRMGGGDDLPLARPKGIASGPDDRVYVADAERDEVVVFDSAGARDYVIGTTGSEPGRFAHPAGVAVAENRLLVADSLNGRVQVFEILGGRP